MDKDRDDKKAKFFELMTQVKKNCLQEIDNEYIEAENAITLYLNNTKSQSKKY